jgi:hypothetical protein
LFWGIAGKKVRNEEGKECEGWSGGDEGQTPRFCFTKIPGILRRNRVVYKPGTVRNCKIPRFIVYFSLFIVYKA